MDAAPLDVRFWVDGDPRPKGSMSGFPIDRGPCLKCNGRGCRSTGRASSCFGGRRVGVSVTDQGDSELKSWQSYVRYHAISARNKAGQRIVEAPNVVEILLVFVLERPSAHWLSDGRLSSAGRTHPIPSTKPDFDKLTRAVADAATGSLVTDDNLVAFGGIAKVFAGYEQKPGVMIHARQTSIVPMWVRSELTFASVNASLPAEATGLLL